MLGKLDINAFELDRALWERITSVLDSSYSTNQFSRFFYHVSPENNLGSEKDLAVLSLD